MPANLCGWSSAHVTPPRPCPSPCENRTDGRSHTSTQPHPFRESHIQPVYLQPGCSTERARWPSAISSDLLRSRGDPKHVAQQGTVVGTASTTAPMLQRPPPSPAAACLSSARPAHLSRTPRSPSPAHRPTALPAAVPPQRRSSQCQQPWLPIGYRKPVTKRTEVVSAAAASPPSAHRGVAAASPPACRSHARGSSRIDGVDAPGSPPSPRPASPDPIRSIAVALHSVSRTTCSPTRQAAKPSSDQPVVRGSLGGE
jgi:hypothetical protein